MTSDCVDIHNQFKSNIFTDPDEGLAFCSVANGRMAFENGECREATESYLHKASTSKKFLAHQC